MQQSTIVSSGWGRVAYIWPDSKEEKVGTMVPPEEYTGGGKHKGDITCMAYSTAQAILVTGASDGSLFGWIYETGYPKYSFSDPTVGGSTETDKSVEFVGFIETEGLMISGTADQWVRVWDLTNGKLADKFPADHGGHEILTIGKITEPMMVTADNHGNIKFWEIYKKTIKPRWMVAGHKDAVTAVEVLTHKGGKYILTGGMDKNVMLHNEKRGVHLKSGKSLGGN